jgi:hypothetical protein
MKNLFISNIIIGREHRNLATAVTVTEKADPNSTYPE